MARLFNEEILKKRRFICYISWSDWYKETITKGIIPLVTEFLSDRGLELSPEKSKITNINDGFDFLSQNVRKYKGKLLIQPSKEAVQSFKNKIKKLFRENRGIPAHALIYSIDIAFREF